MRKISIEILCITNTKLSFDHPAHLGSIKGGIGSGTSGGLPPDGDEVEWPAIPPPK